MSSGQPFTLAKGEKTYLEHESSLGRFTLSSDAITTRLRGRASRIAKQIPPDSLPPDLGYTIGSALVFPGNCVDGASTINGARGLHPRIADRFDLTLECIRRHYRGESSPLGPTLERYADFFAVFSSFSQYVEFFFLHDLWDSRADGRRIAPRRGVCHTEGEQYRTNGQ